MRLGLYEVYPKASFPHESVLSTDVIKEFGNAKEE